MEREGTASLAGVDVYEHTDESGSCESQSNAYELGRSGDLFGSQVQLGMGDSVDEQKQHPQSKMEKEGCVSIQSNKNKKPSPVKPREILRILEKQNYRCAYTDEPLTPENTSADHIIPASVGGSHGPENIALVLGTVNRAKGTMSLEEFVAMCRSVVKKFGP